MFKSSMWRYYQDVKRNLHFRLKWTNSSNYEDILQDIDDKDLPRLRDMLRTNWPKYLDIYIAVDNFIKWKKLNPNTKVNIMCPDGRWDDGTFIIAATEGLHTLVLFTMDQSCERLMSALYETRRIDWHKGPVVHPFQIKFSNALLPVLTNIGQPMQKNGKYYLWYIPKEVALSFDIKCPEDCYLAPLQPTHATEINNAWDYASPESCQFVYNNIKMNYGVGLFAKNTAELLANALITDVGCIGLVRTSTSHRNKGYGRLIIQAIAKQRARETEPTIYTSQENNVMNRLVHALGFICLHECRLVQFESTSESYRT